MSLRNAIEFLVLGAIAYRVCDKALARLFIWRHRLRQEKWIAKERAARIAKLLAETHKAASASMTGHPSPLDVFYVEIPRGVDVMPLLKFTMCMLRMQDPRRFFSQGSSEELDS
ncbi:MAG: hypothetical protein LAO20_16705 [Acidobacteriia bacterium]|nr:hypothetical protein [Terriglobia bacterium]